MTGGFVGGHVRRGVYVLVMAESIDSSASRLRAFAVRNLDDADPAADRVRLDQTGEMRMKPGGRWLPFTAEQWLSSRVTAFAWHARVKMAPLLTAVVEDAFENGHGHLDARVLGRIPLAHGEGPAIDRGETLRYLAELPWNPRAILANPALVITDGADGVARVGIAGHEEVGFIEASFDDAGDVVRVFAPSRPRDAVEAAPWEGVFRGYEWMGGVRVPTQAEVTWLLPDGPFTYWRGVVVHYALERAGAVS